MHVFRLAEARNGKLLSDYNNVNGNENGNIKDSNKEIAPLS